MMLYVRMSTPSRSARAAAFASGRTLNPMMIAFDAAASWTSFSVMPPTPFSRTCGFTASVPSRSTASAMASAEPWTSARMMIPRSLTVPSRTCANRSSTGTLRTGAAPPIEFGLDHGALRQPCGVGAQFQDFCLQQNHLQQGVQAGFLLGRHLDADGVPAPRLGDESAFRQ